jgi:C_GCAxxG_C_C family probable redox protein
MRLRLVFIPFIRKIYIKKPPVMPRINVALELFSDNFNCSQSVLTAFAPEFGLTNDQSLKIACAFGAGMGRQQHTCGAVTGALMVLGLKFGKGENGTNEQKADTYAKTVEFINAFKARNGSINCKELLQGLDMNNADDYKIIDTKNLFETSCVKYVEDATDIVEKIISAKSPV